jgi:hypothetical protein
VTVKPEDVYASFIRNKCIFNGKSYSPTIKIPEAESDKWVVKKNGSKRASRIFNSEEEASTFIKERYGKGYRKSVRKGKKMSAEYMAALRQLAYWFSTKWQDVDMERYFECGFDLFGNRLNHMNFADHRIIKLYIQKDKNIKRKAKFTKESLVNSAKFVKQYMRENNLNFLAYRMARDTRLLAVDHYLQNHIDHNFLTWLIAFNLVTLYDEDIAVIPYINENYRETLTELENVRPFLNELARRM